MSSDAPEAFHPERVAYYEAAGWRAYYDHRWLRAFWLMVRLNREEFRMPLPSALAAAVDIVRASIAFAPVDNDVPKAARYVRRYYEKARRSAGFQAEALAVAELEMKYWVVHRQLAVERIKQPDLDNTAPMVEALADLHAALFDVSPQAARPSAELRALAAKTVDGITGRYSTDVAGDWRLVETYLQQAYQAVPQG
jgi:hypothetical protein